MKKWGKQLLIVTSIFIVTAAIILTTQIYFTGNSVNENSISSNRGLTAGEQCSDGIDNDADGLIDWQLDLCCVDESDDNESCPIGMSMKDGWHVFEKGANTHIIYISSSTGNDTNNGSTPENAVMTIARGQELINAGRPTWLLLKRGDTWNEVFEGVGPNWVSNESDNPFLISSYGNSTQRPLLKTGAYGAFGSSGGGNSAPAGEVNNIALTGIDFYANTRDLSSEDYGIPYNSASGVGMMRGGHNILIEDCKFSFYNTNIIFQGYDAPWYNVTIRRCVLMNAYSNSSHSQGLYVSNTLGALIEENLFYHNGWTGIDRDNPTIIGAYPTIFNHNLYIQSGSVDAIIRNNVIVEASSHGLQLRGGGIIANNLFVGNPIAAFVGDDTGTTVYKHIMNNVVLNGKNINTTQPRGWGLSVQPNVRGGVIDSNIVANINVSGDYAFWIGTNGTDFATNTTLSNNIVYQWPGGIDDYGINTLSINNTVDGLDYPDPNRSVESYNALYGGEATLEDFVANAQSNSRLFWDERYTASSVNDYIRAGFGLTSNLCYDGIQNQNETEVDCGGECNACVVPCTEIWSCTEWNSCSSSAQTRTCTDANSCGTILNKPIETQSCTVSTTSGGSSGGGGRTTQINKGTNSTTSNFTTESIGTTSDNGEKNIWDINSSTNQENVDNQNLDGQKDNSLFNNNIKLVLIIASITMIIGIIWFGVYRIILRKKQTIKTN